MYAYNGYCYETMPALALDFVSRPIIGSTTVLNHVGYTVLSDLANGFGHLQSQIVLTTLDSLNQTGPVVQDFYFSACSVVGQLTQNTQLDNLLAFNPDIFQSVLGYTLLSLASGISTGLIVQYLNKR